jgi:16S rRNA (uracil1498-N3)-methyltransferase
LVLTDGEAHHALHVLRLRPGDSVTVLNGEGAVYSCEVTGSSRSIIELHVLEKRTVPPLPWRISLFQAIPKGKLFEDIVEKATELGVYSIIPVFSQRVVSTPEKPQRKLERWKLAAIEAIKQCGSPWLPQIESPKRIAEALVDLERFDLSLVASLQPNSRHPRRELEPLARKGSQALNISIWIGPEGDFTSEEISRLQEAGARPITLGPNVLRCETAAIYCLSMLNYELQWSFG